MADDLRQGVQSLEKGVAVLTVLAEASEPLRLSEIAERVGMTRSKVHAYLTSLVRTRMASQDQQTGRYTLGEATLQLGMSALKRLDLVRLGREVMLELRSVVSETSFLATWSGRGPLIVAKIEDPGDSVFALQVGAAVTFFTSASGRVFMSYLPRELWDHLLPKDIASTHLEREVNAMVTSTRRQGMASVDPVTLPSHSVLAAPVFDHDGNIKAALCIVGPRGRFDSSLTGRAATALRKAGLDLSRRLGFKGAGG